MSLGMQIQKLRSDGKPAFYRPNGTGRDMYIANNNGGLLSKSMLRTLEIKQQSKPDFIPIKHGGTNVQAKSRSVQGTRKSMPAMVDKFVHYRADGTGRDGYVKWDYGGRIQNFNSKHYTESIFRSTLRSDQIRPSTATNTQASKASTNITSLASPGTASALGISQSSGFDFTNQNYLSPKQIKQIHETHKLQVKESDRLSRPKTANIKYTPDDVSVVDSRYSYYDPRKKNKATKTLLVK